MQGALHTLSFDFVRSERSGKYMEIRLDGKTQAEASEQVQKMRRQVLANPVIENFRFELEEVQ
ncbi:phosphoribosylformylglycinamidine synthase subunit PurS [Chloroflexota bacterium]